MKVGELMVKDVVVASPSDTVQEAARLMVEREVSSIIVVEGGEIKGIITRSDFIERVIARGIDPSMARVSEIMTSPARSIDADRSIIDALRIMKGNRFSQLPVTEGGRLVGVIALRDLLEFLSRFFLPTGR